MPVSKPKAAGTSIRGVVRESDKTRQHNDDIFYIKESARELTNFPGGSVVKHLPPNAGDAGSIPGSGRSPGKGNGNPLQYSCLENPMDRGAWGAIVRGVAKSQTRLRN